MDLVEETMSQDMVEDDAIEPNANLAAAPDQPLGGTAPLSSGHPSAVASPKPACVPQLEERVTKAISAARRSFKTQQKQRAATDLEFIRAELDSACAAAEELFNSWPRLKIPDSSDVDLNDWPTPAPVHKPNPPGVIHPAAPARVFRGPKTATTNINSRSVEASVWILPSHPRVPPYKSWHGVRRNQISIETGQKMFYTERETGETIPLSDDEGATIEQNDANILKGLQREETNTVLLDVLSQLLPGGGDDDEENVLEVVAWHMGISPEAMESRITELKEQQIVEEQRQQLVNWEEKYDFDALDGDFHAAFCRMCRKFGCRVHIGKHPRPVMGPMTLAEEKEREKRMQRRVNKQNKKTATYEELVIEGKEICGTRCYRLLLGAQELEAEAREAAAAAASDDDEDDEEEDAEDEEEAEEEDEDEEMLPDAELDDNGNEVINLISKSTLQDTIMETAQDAAATNKDVEVTSPAKQQRFGNKTAPSHLPDPPLAALNAVLAGTSKVGATRSAVKQLQESKAQAAARAAVAQAAPPPRRISPSPPPGPSTSQIFWNCTACTFRNKGEDATCEMCDTVKGGKNTGAPPPPEVVILDNDDSDDHGGERPQSSPQKTTPLETIAAVEAAEEQPKQQPEQHNDASSSPWQLWEDAALEKGVEIWGRQPCKIAALVGSRTCSQVRARMMTLLPSPLPATLAGTRRNSQNDGSYKNNLNYDLDGNPNRRRRKGGKNATKQPSVVYQRLKRSTEETWPQFHPCGCTGPCNSTCPCHGDANFCEKFCGCDPAWCGNRFQGCQCKCGVNFNKRCSTRQCPCLAAGRECDPDLCKLCIPTLHKTNEPGYQCNNFRIRLRQKRRVLMGLSDVQGWGAFLAGPAVKKDEFLGEYCGELIDQLEADRRGKVYDRDDNSYLFDLNEQWVIDARQKGNKLRFANHSPTANCRAEILMVDGDHRVAILANKDLVPGEELFYDYRYDRRVAPDWAQHSGRGDRGDGEASGSGGRGRGRGR